MLNWELLQMPPVISDIKVLVISEITSPGSDAIKKFTPSFGIPYLGV